MKPARSEVHKITLMLGGAIFSTFLVVAALVYSFGFSERGRAYSILLAPPELERVECNGEIKKSIGWQQYERFYQMVAHARALEEVGKEAIGSFEQTSAPPVVLVVTGYREGKEIVQRVECAGEGDVFRVCTEGVSHTEWVYFSSPDIYQKAMAFLGL